MCQGVGEHAFRLLFVGLYNNLRDAVVADYVLFELSVAHFFAHRTVVEPQNASDEEEHDGIHPPKAELDGAFAGFVLLRGWCKSHI